MLCGYAGGQLSATVIVDKPILEEEEEEEEEGEEIRGEFCES